MFTKTCNTIARRLTETGTLSRINYQLFKEGNYVVFKPDPNVRSLHLTEKLWAGAPAQDDPCAPKDVYKVSPLCPSKGYEYKKKTASLKCPNKGCPSLKKPEPKPPPEPPKKDDCKKEEKPKQVAKEPDKKETPKDSEKKDKSSLGKEIIAACFKNTKKNEPKKPAETCKKEEPKKEEKKACTKKEETQKKPEPPKKQEPPKQAEPKKAEAKKEEKKPCPTLEEKQCAKKELKGCEKPEKAPTCGKAIDECSKEVRTPVSPEVIVKPKKERPPYKIVCPPSKPAKGQSCIKKKCCEKKPEEERCCSTRPWPFNLLEKRCNKPPKKPCLEKQCKKPPVDKIVPSSDSLLIAIASTLLNTKMQFHTTTSLAAPQPICLPKQMPPCSGDCKISDTTEEFMLQLRQIARENKKKQPETCIKEEESPPCLVPKDGGWKMAQEFILMRDPEIIKQSPKQTFESPRLVTRKLRKKQ